jgi:hypothetical protein
MKVRDLLNLLDEQGVLSIPKEPKKGALQALKREWNCEIRKLAKPTNKNGIRRLEK